jgi:hypothetical protein
MLKSGLVIVSLLVGLSVVAAADNVISEWGGAQGGYVISGGEAAAVVITAPGTYKFQALDPNGPSGLGIINHITVDPNCPAGTVTVSVVRDPNEVGGSSSPGALDLKEIDLSNASQSNIQVVNIAGDLAELGAVRATNVTGAFSPSGSILNDIFLDRLDGSIWCHGAENITVSSGTASAAQVFVFAGYAGTMNLTGTPFIFVNGAMSGSIDVTGDPHSIMLREFPQAGVITVHGNVRDAVFLAGDLAGTFHVTGDLVGYVDLQGNSLTGSLIVDGDVGPDGAVWIRDAGADIAGLVQIGGDCEGYVTIGPPPGNDQEDELATNNLSGALTIGGELSGGVLVDHGHIYGSIACGSLSGPIRVVSNIDRR